MCRYVVVISLTRTASISPISPVSPISRRRPMRGWRVKALLTASRAGQGTGKPGDVTGATGPVRRALSKDPSPPGLLSRAV